MALLVLAAAGLASVGSENCDGGGGPPPPPPPIYPGLDGPVVLFDQGHGNGPTIGGAYSEFANILEADGYSVDTMTPSATTFDPEVGILVVPSASVTFQQDQVSAIGAWVYAGGGLLVIGDHPGGVGHAGSIQLAAAFGVHFALAGAILESSATCPLPNFDCYACTTEARAALPFTTGNSVDPTPHVYDIFHPIIQGRNSYEAVNHYLTFGGDALTLSPMQDMTYEPIGVFWQDVLIGATPSDGSQLQSVGVRYGAGRVFVAAEAMTFGVTFLCPGMDHARAHHNRKYLRNIIHWLDQLIGP